MDGEIGVDSEVGGGSTFYIDIPLRPLDQASQLSNRDPLTNTNIIVIHPSSKACSVYMQQLGDWGAQVTAVRSLDDLESRLQFTDKSESISLIVDARIHARHGQDMFNKLSHNGFMVDREVVLVDMGHEHEVERLNDLVQVVSKPLFRDNIVKAITGSSKGSSANRSVITEEDRASCYKILLVEDNKVNQRVAAAMLKKMGHQVDLAENGAEAVKNVQMEKYSAVLMDCQMPVLDGWEATRQIRKLGAEYEDIPIIALTANALAGDRDVCIEAGMTDYLSKPVKRQELEEVIERFCAPH